MTYENPFEQALTGQEVKDWVWYHMKHNTPYSKVAKTLGKVFNLNDEKFYMLKMCGEVPQITEVPEKGISYDIPCKE